MVELLVVIGVIMVLIGLVVPVLGRSVEKARTAADLATVRSDAMLVTQYADQNQGIYPVATPRRCSASTRWYEPLVASGLLSGPAEADPRVYPRWGQMTILLSQSLVASPGEFVWGMTRPCRESPSSPIGSAMVSFPSAKGMMWKAFDPEWISPQNTAPSGVSHAFCCGDLYPSPVCFCDGSGQIGTFMDFSPGGMPVVVHGHQVGVPVSSPWGGYLARER